MHLPDDRYEPITVAEAASRLKVSESTVRRMIRDGKLEAEREQRPQGEIVRVLWPAATDVPPPVTQMPDTYQEIATGLLERLAAQDDTIAAKDAEIARIYAVALALAERAARAEARADLLAAELERLRERRWWRFW
jgi:excisionase family DNA binding protein